MPSNLISEVVTGPEAKQVAAYSDELKKIKATQKLVAATVALRSPAYKFRAAPSRRWKASDKRRPTWLAAQQPLTMGSVADWIRRRLLEDCRCHTDPIAGRFMILGPAGAAKSVAWTERGWHMAAVLCLEHAWGFWLDYHNRPAPYNYAEWFEELAAAAPA